MGVAGCPQVAVTGGISCKLLPGRIGLLLLPGDLASPQSNDGQFPLTTPRSTRYNDFATPSDKVLSQ